MVEGMCCPVRLVSCCTYTLGAYDGLGPHNGPWALRSVVLVGETPFGSSS